MDSTRAWQTESPRSNSETSVVGLTSRPPGSPPAAPFLLWVRSHGPKRRPVCPSQFRVYWGAQTVRKTPQNKASPSQPRSLPVLKGERTGCGGGPARSLRRHVTRWPSAPQCPRGASERVSWTLMPLRRASQSLSAQGSFTHGDFRASSSRSIFWEMWPSCFLTLATSGVNLSQFFL